MTSRSGLLAVTLLAATSLAACRTGINVLADIPPNRMNELANFTCVTSELAADVRANAQPADPRYVRAAQLYESARSEFNTIIDGIADDVQSGEKVDLVGYWGRFGAAQTRQQELVAYVEQQEGFGFGGIGLLVSAAAPFAEKAAKRFLEQKVRAAAASYLRREFMLPAFAEAQHCLTDN